MNEVVYYNCVGCSNLFAAYHDSGDVCNECRIKLKSKSVWLLTYEVNEYDQYGEYYAKIWWNKPSLKQVENYLRTQNHDINDAPHILNGGGRKDKEHFWYHLKEISL